MREFERTSRFGKAAMLLFCLHACLGCTPRVIVHSNPTPRDKGIRYYRPKPYLKVEPAEVAIEKNQTRIVPGLVRISLAYLPDFSEEYSIDVRPGLGTANVELKLEDGWNLTEIGQDLDSQTDENLEALGSILSAVGDVVPTATSSADASQHSFTVSARNVPIGFYESVIGRDARGCKRLYGFRYVGFLPFAGCPLDMGGAQSACCNSPETNLYGLTFIDGQMAFQSLTEMSTLPHNSGQSPPSATASGLGSAGDDNRPGAGLSGEQLVIQLRTYLTNRFEGIGEVRVEEEQAGPVIRIYLNSDLNPSAPDARSVGQAAEAWLAENSGGAKPPSVEVIGSGSREPLSIAAPLRLP